ncbi:MAG TPA: DHA2 family efflux MFS transporter permease subunit [Gammaproteobacteria bacterium]|nr:DHA2 family efflux MFS transporter permease subunit [Gammaproteobacteria bacterium]
MTERRIKNRGWITVVVMAAAIMQIVDTTIVTIALPHMKGSLSATTDQISWVLTSYLISSGIFMPLTGYFTDRIGRKRYLLISIVGFVAASIMCGLSTSLQEIVLFRLLQGVAGAGLAPSAQAILVTVYPKKEHGRAMAIFGLGAMIGPILGPTLGGLLTQIATWRWTFFINVPIGIAAFVGAWLFIPETETKERRMDWSGFVYLAMAVGCLQFMLDRGTRYDWFSSHLIQILAIASVIGFVLLISHCLKLGKGAVFDIRLFTNRNFGFSTLTFALFMFSMYGSLTLLPQLVEGLYHYPVLTTGLVFAPRGLAAIPGMLLVGRYINRVGAKPFIFVGTLLVAYGTYVTTGYDLHTGMWFLIWPQLLRGFGVGMTFVPLSTLAFSMLKPEDNAEAAGMRQLGRTIGASMGAALSSAIITRMTQVSWNQIGGHVTRSNPALEHLLSQMHMSLNSEAAALLGAMVGRQAEMRAYLDSFLVLGLSVLVTLPLLLFMKEIKEKKKQRNAGGTADEAA